MAIDSLNVSNNGRRLTMRGGRDRLFNDGISALALFVFKQTYTIYTVHSPGRHPLVALIYTHWTGFRYLTNNKALIAEYIFGDVKPVRPHLMHSVTGVETDHVNEMS